MWWRILVPTWRFFDVVGPRPELFVKIQGEWRPVLERPHFRWFSLFFNPVGGFYHACNNLLERLVIEISEGAQPSELVSYSLVRDLAGGKEFKIEIDGEDFLQSAGTSE